MTHAKWTIGKRLLYFGACFKIIFFLEAVILLRYYSKGMFSIFPTALAVKVPYGPSKTGFSCPGNILLPKQQPLDIFPSVGVLIVAATLQHEKRNYNVKMTKT